MGGAHPLDAWKIARERRADWPTTSFLAELDIPVLRDFLVAGELVRFRKGDVLLSESEPSDHAFLLLDACVKVTAQLDAGGQALLAIRIGGDVVGEVAAMDGGARTATVSACGQGPAVAVRVGRHELRSLLSRYPDAALSLTAAVGRKLRTATRRRVDITGCKVAARIARVVLELAEDYGCPVPGGTLICVNLTQLELGSLVSVGETMTQRALRELRGDGLVVNFGRRLLVPDMAALRLATRPG
jgi:CRP/FNR family transcriptional regulator, cyclic AMP receptor protein